MSRNEFDTIVIGGGHNGLSAAAYLTQAGQRVLVVEALGRLGGFCTTDEYAPDSQGFRFSPHALDHVLINVPPSIVTELGLSRFGLDYQQIDPFGVTIGENGLPIVLWRDLDRTVASIAAVSEHDAQEYGALIAQGQALWRIAIPYLMGHPTRPSLKTLASVFAGLVAAGRLIPHIVRLVMQPASVMVAARFTHPAIRGLLENLAASGGIPLDAPGSGLLATVLAIEHQHGVYRPRGGSAKLIEALASCTTHQGGEIRTGTPVEKILIEKGTATGVQCGGARITAGAVLAAIDPVSLAQRLIGPGRLTASVLRELAVVGQYRANLAMAAIGARLAALPNLRPASGGSAGQADALLAATLYLSPNDAGMSKAVTQARNGCIPQDLPVWLIVSSAADTSLVPEGSGEHILYLYLPVLPRHLAVGLWADQREALFAQAILRVERDIPGISNLILSHFVHTPDDLPGWSFDCRGGPYHADLSLDQLGPWRPFPSFSGYRTPVRKLFHAGAGAHPLGTLNGWSGRSSARLILRG